MTIALVMASVILVSACSGIAVRETALTAVHTKLLYEEAYAAEQAMEEVPFTAEQREIMDDVIIVLESYRQRLGVLHEQSGGDILMAAATAEPMLADMRVNYLRGKRVYLDYLAANNLQPDPVLVAYDQSAVAAYTNVKAVLQASEDAAVRTSEMTEYLRLALRVLAVAAV